MLKKFALLLVDVCTVLFLMGVVGVIISFAALVVFDVPARYTFEFMSGFLIGSTSITALALLIVWRKA